MPFCCRRLASLAKLCALLVGRFVLPLTALLRATDLSALGPKAAFFWQALLLQLLVNCKTTDDARSHFGRVVEAHKAHARAARKGAVTGEQAARAPPPSLRGLAAFFKAQLRPWAESAAEAAAAAERRGVAKSSSAPAPSSSKKALASGAAVGQVLSSAAEGEHVLACLAAAEQVVRTGQAVAVC